MFKIEKPKIFSFLQTNEMGAVNFSDPDYVRWLCNVKILSTEDDIQFKCYKEKRNHYIYITKKKYPKSHLCVIKYINWKPYHSYKAAERNIEKIKLEYLARLV